MPIFEYRCTHCGHMFEQLVAKTDSRVHCDQCGSMQSEKLFSTFSARVETRRPAPCSSGHCPGAAPEAGCTGGGCPYS